MSFLILCAKGGRLGGESRVGELEMGRFLAIGVFSAGFDKAGSA